MKVGILVSRIRVEEKLLIDKLVEKGVDHVVVDVRELVFDPQAGRKSVPFDVVFERCISQTQAVTAIKVYESLGIPCVNPSAVIECCGDKLATSLALIRDGIATPRIKVALEPESGLKAVEEMGYPCVLKPTVGSWGRLLGKVNDKDAAEAILEHKFTLGGYQHSVVYVQEYVKKKAGAEYRVFVVGDDVLCGIARTSPHWITNTARGGQASVLEITPEIRDLSLRAAKAVGGGILAIDLMEAENGPLMVNEVNHTMEFRNSIAPTGVDIPGKMIDYVVAKGNATRPAQRTPVGAAR